MSGYIAQFLAPDGNFIKSEPLDGDNDKTAIAAARKLLDGNDIEIWSGDRKVIQLDHKPENPNPLTSSIIELRQKAAQCRQLARMGVDAEIAGQLVSLVEECEVKAIQAEAIEKKT